jgi:hypothetical protein
MDTNVINQQVDVVSGEVKPAEHLETTQISAIRPEEIETAEPDNVQQEVMKQPDAIPDEGVAAQEAFLPEQSPVVPEQQDDGTESEDTPVAFNDADGKPAAVDAESETPASEPAVADSENGETASDTPALDESETEKEDEATTGEVAADSEPLLTELPTTPDNYCGELQEAIEVGAIGMIDKQELLKELKEAVAHPEKYSREQVDRLKQDYYRIINAETEELKRVFLENGGEEDGFIAPPDENASLLYGLLAEYKKKWTAIREKEERLKEENYTKKLHLIDRLLVLVESQDDFNRRYNEFKDIQQKWKEYEPVPYRHARELLRKYQAHSERFYDLIKINSQLRDYDFKKNLELKTSICEAAEKLTAMPDVVFAYHQYLKLFQQWRDTGPVAREFRETLWTRFKDATSPIIRKNQALYDARRASETKNLKDKTALCEQIENIDYAALVTYRDWELKSQEVIELQKKWHGIGYASKKVNVKLYDRFRVACDRYFEKRSEYRKTARKEIEKSLLLRQELLEKVEALKHSTDWKEAAAVVIELKKEWRQLAPIAYKRVNAMWKQFNAACDYVFAQKSSLFHSQKTAETANLETKRMLIEKIRAIDPGLPLEEARLQLKLLMAEWKAVGFVPIREKDSLQKEYRVEVDRQLERLNVAQSNRKQQRAAQTSTGGQDSRGRTLSGSRDKLMQQYSKLKSEVLIYENNIGFFNTTSKGGNNMRREMEQKIERLKEDMALIVKKINAIDENLE